MNVDNGILHTYAEQDTWGGFNDDSGWPRESISRMEGQIIYAIMRHMRPRHALEFGVCGGCSSTHILQALADNGKGELMSFDVMDYRQPGPPGSLRPRWKFVRANGITYDYNSYNCDVCFEDTSHTHHSTSNLARKAIELGAKCLIVHDAVNPTSGGEVRRALNDVLGRDTYLVLMTDDSHRGLAVWLA